jgi:solitary outer membrane autotransporter-like beta-barrel protein
MNRSSRSSYFNLVLGAVLIATSPFVVAETALDVRVRHALEETLSMATLMTSGTEIQLGFMDFNPNDVPGVNDEALGSDASIASRNTLTLFTLPAHYSFDLDDPRLQLRLVGRMAYLNETQEFYLDKTSTGKQDKTSSTSLVASVGLNGKRYFDEHWHLITNLNVHVIEFENKTTYNSVESRILAPVLDGAVANFTMQAWIAEPVVGMGYRTLLGRFDTRLHSTGHYFKGGDISSDGPAHDVRPEAWYWSNGVSIHQPLFFASARPQTMLYRLSQVNVGVDLVSPVGSHRYYELGVGWMIDTHDILGWVKNIGVSANINYGSNLRGGTLALLYNVE